MSPVFHTETYSKSSVLKAEGWREEVGGVTFLDQTACAFMRAQLGKVLCLPRILPYARLVGLLLRFRIRRLAGYSGEFQTACSGKVAEWR